MWLEDKRADRISRQLISSRNNQNKSIVSINNNREATYSKRWCFISQRTTRIVIIFHESNLDDVCLLRYCNVRLLRDCIQRERINLSFWLLRLIEKSFASYPHFHEFLSLYQNGREFFLYNSTWQIVSSSISIIDLFLRQMNKCAI